jgi:hypothetical protein
MATSTAPQRSVQLPTTPVLISTVYAACVLLAVAVFTGQIIFSDKDPHRSEGPIEELILVSVFGTAALVIGVGLALWLARTPERARVGSFVLVALSILSVPFFWAGAPGIFGACTAWCAGLTKGGRPLSGGARVAGIVGAFIVLLNVVLTVGGLALTPVFG